MGAKSVSVPVSADQRVLTVWLVDPISYSGMAYSDACQVASLGDLGVNAVLLGSDDWMLRSLTSIPRVSTFRGTSGDGRRVRRGLAYVMSLVRLIRLVRRHRPQIVHWQYLEVPLADLTAMLAIRALGVRQVYTAHELLPWNARAYHPTIMRGIYSVVDRIVTHRADQRIALCARFGVPGESVAVVGWGGFEGFATPDLPQDEARARVGIAPEARVALFFGAIRPSKGLDVLLAAWPIVVAALPDAQLFVVGKPYKAMRTETVRETIDLLGIQDSVTTVFSHVDPVLTNDYYRAADVVALPYHEIGTSGVLRYAYCSARPVVATSVGEHPAHVRPGETGELVQPADPSALASALITSLADRTRAAAHGQQALAYAKEAFAWPDVAAGLLEVYHAASR